MIETRPLTKDELILLLAEASAGEVKNLDAYLHKYNLDPYDFLNKDTVYKFGLIVDHRPIYFAYIKKHDGKYFWWTVVNSDVKEQYSLYKHAKKALNDALNLYSPIYATMEKQNATNIRWVERMGFNRVYEDESIITFRIAKKE